ncbi:16S rRNA (adenine(1518)-N(6)/adenine(1519)-N(6))-dimethyltransferase RsmA [Vaginisenegalia massiliensis]|uniref:16S rRNA (adenine(1518)-N(6)/adenine(1519)-N(6))- dimethyltransferase RsmA n=1 Tax=Vaginisenegalia massiliensis TaxID=2058294 RepID=UPI000F5279BC|nr:16S rRNA (adenine(1518)-N(6)/adenine(1519)-N(6))-dimethyltransferase RsmA [Vaginisenegalia massiliensis]
MTEFRPIATPTRTVDIMKRYDIKMKKSLGQNFLIEPRMLEKMIQAGQIDQTTTVIEIGPGIGALTQYLAHYAERVLAFEIDQRFVSILGETLADYDNVQIIPQDILKVNFAADELTWLRQVSRLVVVANLPYYITTPIIMHLIESGLPFDRLVMMMQKEVAERMTAQVGTKAYNSLTIAIQQNMEAKIDFIVPKNVFIPKPNVDSAVLVLTRRQSPLVHVSDPLAFQSFVQVAFQQRRKTLWNNLKTALVNSDYSVDRLQELFDQTGIEPVRRAETLSIHEFAHLFQLYQQQNSLVN